MLRSLVEQLRCPACVGAVVLKSYRDENGGAEVMDGVLTCAGCGAAYLVFRGIPKMLPVKSVPGEFLEPYRARLAQDAPALAALPPTPEDPEFSFSLQWSQHRYDELTWELYLPERVKLFYRYTGLSQADASRVKILDAGCGNGTLTAEIATEGFSITGLDFSDSVFNALQYVRAKRQDARDRVEYVQGDVWHPPFPDQQFDLIYSDGVLHHTPDTKTAFMALTRLVKPGGRFFVWLYRSDMRFGQKMKMRTVWKIRDLTANWSYKAKWRLCMAAAAVMLSALSVLRLFGWKKRRMLPLRLKALNLFDTIAPTFNFEHTPPEVAGWFAEAGFKDVAEATIHEFRLADTGFAVIGTRP